MIAELGIRPPSGISAYEHHEAAIWGDCLYVRTYRNLTLVNLIPTFFFQACLYASNCNEFINWDPATMSHGSEQPQQESSSIQAETLNLLHLKFKLVFPNSSRNFGVYARVWLRD